MKEKRKCAPKTLVNSGGACYDFPVRTNAFFRRTTPWQKEKPEEIKQNIYKKTAIHRFASIEEVVEAYRFCIDNPFVNGSMIEVNGGYCYK